MELLSLFLVSDLHVDHWSPEYNIFYPCGDTANYPIQWLAPDNPSILVVAGDVSDVMGLSIDYLDMVSKNYEYVLFIDGNHEHIFQYPHLYNYEDFNFRTKVKENNKLIYLPQQDFVIRDIAIIGFCGWWDYSEGLKYGGYKGWIDPLNDKEKEDILSKNIKDRAVSEFNRISEKLAEYDKREDINTVVVVTHTVPKEYFSRDISTDHNSQFHNLSSKKLKYWFYGHNHVGMEKEINGVKFISNPRGRPNDYNRKRYQAKQILI